MSIFITGSNSKLLSGELASHLTGRTVSFKILPFTFKEYHDFQRSRGSTKEKAALFEEYLMWGGFPLVAKEEDWEVKHVVLSNQYDSIVLEDIILSNGVASPHALQRVLDYIIANSSATISGNTIAGSLSDEGRRVSAPTIYNYLKYIEEACICDIVARYDIRGKTVLSFMEKVYVCDLGFFTLRKNRVKDEFGYLFETLCYNELVARGYTIYIGKTHKGEVDFIAEKDGSRSYYQAAYLLSTEETINREFDAFLAIKDNYPKYLLTMDVLRLSRDGVIHMNIMDWLLSAEP
ncbi:MAG: ATP-binding protein [Sphaerochaeta sp.]|jgi:predicted AAA+ superfamily ATPase|nr:ATP-binding protein [Sphaerochaeta sp.]